MDFVCKQEDGEAGPSETLDPPPGRDANERPPHQARSFEVHILRCNKAVVRELEFVFPHVDVKAGVYAVPTLQRSRYDLVSYGGEIEVEKDRLLVEFLSFGAFVCDALVVAGHWADYIDPCSGLPMLAPSSGKTFNEVDSMQSLLQYRVMNAGCCKVLLHPDWGSAVYPASLFTNAPPDLVAQTVQAYPSPSTPTPPSPSTHPSTPVVLVSVIK